MPTKPSQPAKSKKPTLEKSAKPLKAKSQADRPIGTQIADLVIESRDSSRAQSAALEQILLLTRRLGAELDKAVAQNRVLERELARAKAKSENLERQLARSGKKSETRASRESAPKVAKATRAVVRSEFKLKNEKSFKAKVGKIDEVSRKKIKELADLKKDVAVEVEKLKAGTLEVGE